MRDEHVYIEVPVSAAEKARLQQAAALAGLDVSSWLLQVALAEAERGLAACPPDGRLGPSDAPTPLALSAEQRDGARFYAARDLDHLGVGEVRGADSLAQCVGLGVDASRPEAAPLVAALKVEYDRWQAHFRGSPRPPTKPGVPGGCV